MGSDKIVGIEGIECGVWTELMWLRVGTGGGIECCELRVM